MTAVGVWFYSIETDRYLYLMRSDSKYPMTWGLPGGKIETGETLLDAMQRECQEEIGGLPDYIKLFPLEQFTSPDEKFIYHTFFCCVTHEFRPTLNDEHLGYAWIDSDQWPQPMHPGLWHTVNFDTVRQKVESAKSLVRLSSIV